MTTTTIPNANALKVAATHAWKNDHKPALNGARVEYDGETLTIAATDSYRLFMHEARTGKAGDAVAVTIPLSALKAMRVVKTSGAGTLTIDGGRGSLRVGGTEYGFDVVGASFPDYRPLFPAVLCDGYTSRLNPAYVADASKAVAIAAAPEAPRYADTPVPAEKSSPHM